MKKKNSVYEWSNTKDAMRSALSSLNTVLLALPKLEESAKREAKIVKKILNSTETKSLTIEWLTDSLHQASIDYQANK